MKKAKRLLSYILVLSLIVSCVNVTTVSASTKVSTGKYILSNAAGTYNAAFTLKIKAKKGYKVYYTTGSTGFTKSKLVKSGKTKSIKISKTTKVRIYAVKSTKIITKKALKKLSSTNKGVKSYKYKIVSNDSSTSDSSMATDATTSDNSSNVTVVTDTVTQVVTTDTDKANDTSSDKTDGDTSTASGSTGSDTSTDTGASGDGTSENTVNSGSSSGSGETGSGSNEPGNDSGESGSGDAEDSGADDETAKYTATFTTDEHATINIYYTQDYITADESNVTTAIARNSGTGESDVTGDGQINFKVVPKDGYAVDAITITPEDGYKNLKLPEETGNANTYRITKVTKDLNVTVTTKEATVEDVTENVPLAITDSNNNDISIYSDGTTYTAAIDSEGEYNITGAETAVANLKIIINTIDNVKLNISDIEINNEADIPVISSSLAANVDISFSEITKVTGTFLSLTNKGSSATISGDGTLNIDTSDMYNEAEDEGYDGIFSKGLLDIESGNIIVNSTGDSIKGTNGVTLNGGTFDLTSTSGSTIKSKSGEIIIAGGTLTLSSDTDDAIKAYDKDDITTSHKVSVTGGDITVEKSGGYGIRGAVVEIDGKNTKLTIKNTAEDGIRAKASETLSGTILTTDDNGTGVVNIKNGTITMTDIQGDGIQAEYLNIDDGTINIKTAYDYAGTNFYASNNVSGSSYNSVSSGGMSNNSTETIKYDTGSHKGFKVGTNAKTFKYSSVDTESGYTAGTTYTQTASGLLNITGGTIIIDTTAAGIKFNVGNDNQTIIGSPDDGIKANYKANISGGTITINASDDGICAVEELDVTDQAVIEIETAYEGIEGKTIIIGTKGDSSTTLPSVSVYTNDDGINASAKTLSYVYADEDETSYTKTKTAQSKVSSTTVYSGYVYVMIGDDKTTHSVSLTSVNGDKYNGSYKSMGDGIDCNGSMYAYGGKTVVFGMTSGSESPIDMDTNFECEAGATMLLVGADTMGETSKISTSQGYIVYGSSSSTGFGGKGGGNQSSSSLSIGNYQILSGSTELESFTLCKTAVYLLYTSPSVKSGSSYTLKGTSSTSLTAK